MDNYIPLLDLKHQYKAIKNEIKSSINRVLDSQRFILGPEVENFEGEFSTFCRSKYAIGVSSGSDALLISLMALNIGPGDEVITTSYSFFATVGAIVRLGATPVFTDINLDTFNMEASQIEGLISPKTKAIIPVHLFGQTADMELIKVIGAKYHIPIIEDAAQAIGARCNNIFAGTIGDIGCFSFFPSKNLGGIGDGGMVITNNQDVANKIRRLRSHGTMSKYIHIEVGGNFRLDEIQAAALRVKLLHLNDWTKARRKNARRYINLFEDLIRSEKIEGVISLPKELIANKHVYNQFVIRVQGRDQLLNHLREKRIGCEIYYPTPLPMQPCLTHFRRDNRSYPNSEMAANTSLAIPISPELTDRQQHRVVDSIFAFLRSCNNGEDVDS